MHDKLMGVAGSLLATCMYLFYKMLLLVVKKKKIQGSRDSGNFSYVKEIT